MKKNEKDPNSTKCSLYILSLDYNIIIKLKKKISYSTLKKTNWKKIDLHLKMRFLA